MKRLLEHLLQEDDCARIFGNTLFGDLKGGERDLTQEKEIRKAVQSFFSDKLTYRDKPENVVNAFRELLKCKGKFPNELQPNVSLVYRGVRMTMPDILKIKDWKFVDDTRQEIIGTGNYQSKYPIQSWSASKIRAEFFAIDFPSWRKKYAENLDEAWSEVVTYLFEHPLIASIAATTIVFTIVMAVMILMGHK